jgi:hypothetical protein
VRRWAAIVLVLATFLLGATAAQGVVRNVSLTDPVRVGDYASLTVEVSPRARCTIEVIYDKVRSTARSQLPRRPARRSMSAATGSTSSARAAGARRSSLRRDLPRWDGTFMREMRARGARPYR